MKELGILFDSFAGINLEKCEEEGFSLIPLQLEIDGKTYFDCYEKANDYYYEKILNSKNSYTSQPPIKLIEEKLEEMAKKYDKVICLPINSSVSSTFNQISLAASKYKDQVYVVNNSFLGSEFLFVGKKLKEKYKKIGFKKTLEWLRKLIAVKKDSFVIINDLKRMEKGGRISGYKKIFLKNFKLLPLFVFNLEGIKLKTFVRNSEKGILKSVKIIEKDKEDFLDFFVGILYTQKEKNYFKLKEILVEKKINIKWESKMSSVVFNHVGEGAIGITLLPNLE